jgi:hypothetical protein
MVVGSALDAVHGDRRAKWDRSPSSGPGHATSALTDSNRGERFGLRESRRYQFRWREMSSKVVVLGLGRHRVSSLVSRQFARRELVAGAIALAIVVAILVVRASRSSAKSEACTLEVSLLDTRSVSAAALPASAPSVPVVAPSVPVVAPSPVEHATVAKPAPQPAPEVSRPRTRPAAPPAKKARHADTAIAPVPPPVAPTTPTPPAPKAKDPPMETNPYVYK